MSYCDPSEPCKHVCKSVHEWVKIWVFVLDENENMCEFTCVCGADAPFLSNWSDFTGRLIILMTEVT